MSYSRFANNRGTALLSQTSGRVCSLWHITRLDSEEFFLTDHDQDIDFQSDTYSPAGGGNASAISSESGMKEDNMDIEGIIDSSVITTADLAGGLFDGATVIQYLVDWMFPWASIFEENHFVIGEVTWTGDIWKARMNGIHYILEKTLGHVAVKDCPYVFGKWPCDNSAAGGGKPTGTIRWYCDIIQVFSLQEFRVDSVLPVQTDGYYNGCRVEFATGNNAGHVNYVKEYYAITPGRYIRLILPVPETISVGDDVYVYNKCDKKFATCQITYQNNKNFGGNPDMPGMDKITSGPEIGET